MLTLAPLVGQSAAALTRANATCDANDAWRRVSAAPDAGECNVEHMSRLLSRLFDEMGNQSAPTASSMAARLLDGRSWGGAVPRRRLLAGGRPLPSRPLVPSWMEQTPDHPAREQDYTLYGTYRVVCAFWRHFAEILMVPEVMRARRLALRQPAAALP